MLQKRKKRSKSKLNLEQHNKMQQKCHIYKPMGKILYSYNLAEVC